MKKIKCNLEKFEALKNIKTLDDITPENAKLFEEIKCAKNSLEIPLISIGEGLGGLIFLFLAGISFASLIQGPYVSEPAFAGSVCTLFGGGCWGIGIKAIIDNFKSAREEKKVRKALEKSGDWKRVCALMEEYNEIKAYNANSQMLAELHETLQETKMLKFVVEKQKPELAKHVDDKITLIQHLIEETKKDANKGV